MRNNATFIDSEQLKEFRKLDKWLSTESWKTDIEIKSSQLVRELISKIEIQGYYYEGEADVLNELRTQFIKHKKR